MYFDLVAYRLCVVHLILKLGICRFVYDFVLDVFWFEIFRCVVFVLLADLICWVS